MASKKKKMKKSCLLLVMASLIMNERFATCNHHNIHESLRARFATCSYTLRVLWYLGHCRKDYQTNVCVCFFNGEKHGSWELAIGTRIKEVGMGWSGLMSEIKLTRTYVIPRYYTGYNKDLYQLGCILNFFLNGIFYLCWTYTWTCTDSNVALYECPFPRKRILILTWKWIYSDWNPFLEDLY